MKKKKIAFKVVLRANNKSIMAGGDFCLSYDNGKTIKAAEHTLGVFCFKTRYYAQAFVNTFCPRSGKVIRVQPIGRGTSKALPMICSWISSRHLWRYYTDEDNSLDTFNPDYKAVPSGTICYPAVKVLP